jgi:hypothetical protein
MSFGVQAFVCPPIVPCHNGPTLLKSGSTILRSLSELSQCVRSVLLVNIAAAVSLMYPVFILKV